MTRHRTTGTVRETFNQAQRQAAAMSEPPPAWDAPRARVARSSRRRVAIVAASVVAGAVIGCGWAWWPAATKAPSQTADAPPSTAPLAPAPVRPTASEAADAVAPPPTAAASLSVSRRAGVIRIAANDAPWRDAVRALAEATRTTVNGSDSIAAMPGRVTLNWQGKDTAAAWEALLGRVANTMTSCGGSQCELWIIGVNPARPASPAPATAVAPVMPQVPPAEATGDSETN